MRDDLVLFSHIPKSGGTTLKWIMRNSFALRHLEIDPINPKPAIPESAAYHPNGLLDRAKTSFSPVNAQDLKRIRKGFPWIRSLQSHNLSPSIDLGAHRWFTYLREPRKQVASWFQFLVEFGKRTDLDFFEYMQTEYPRERQVKMLAGKPDFEAARKVVGRKNVFCGLVEDFDRSLLLLRRLHVPELRLGYTAQGISKRTSIAQDLLHDPKALRVIDSATVEDRKLYAYVKNELYPSYIESYGNDLDADAEKLRNERATFNWARLNLARIQSRFFYERLWLPLKRN